MQIISQFGEVEQIPEEKSEGYKMQEKKNETKSKRGSKGSSHAVIQSTKFSAVNLPIRQCSSCQRIR
jgi:hypothetical protein